MVNDVLFKESRVMPVIVSFILPADAKHRQRQTELARASTVYTDELNFLSHGHTRQCLCTTAR